MHLVLFNTLTFFGVPILFKIYKPWSCEANQKDHGVFNCFIKDCSLALHIWGKKHQLPRVFLFSFFSISFMLMFISFMLFISVCIGYLCGFMAFLNKILLPPKVPEISHQKIPEEEQPARLAACRGEHQGELRTALLPDQPGRGGGRGRGLNLCCSFVK